MGLPGAVLTITSAELWSYKSRARESIDSDEVHLPLHVKELKQINTTMTTSVTGDQYRSQRMYDSRGSKPQEGFRRIKIYASCHESADLPQYISFISSPEIHQDMRRKRAQKPRSRRRTHAIVCSWFLFIDATFGNVISTSRRRPQQRLFMSSQSGVEERLLGERRSHVIFAKTEIGSGVSLA